MYGTVAQRQFYQRGQYKAQITKAPMAIYSDLWHPVITMETYEQSAKNMNSNY